MFLKNIKEYLKKKEKFIECCNLGIKNLSYKIKNLEQANYVVLFFKRSNKIIEYLKSKIKYNESIIRFLIIKIKKNEIIKKIIE